MIVLDTNVVSEPLSAAPNKNVIAWLNAQERETLFISAVTIAEMAFGISTLPKGKRREILEHSFAAILERFKGRTLAFDTDAALRYGKLALAARQTGKGFPVPDGYIAAIAASQEFVVATRDVAPFKAVGLKVINPWMG